MRQQPIGSDSVSALLLQEAVLDASIWSPLKNALQNDVSVIEVSPPVAPVILSDEHWAAYLADWIATESDLDRAHAVVSHGHAAFAALLVADQGMVSESVIIIDPAVSSLMPSLSELARARLYTSLQGEESQSKLTTMFASIDPEELQLLRQTGRLSEASTQRFIEAIVSTSDIDQPVLSSLVRRIATERLSMAFSEGIQLRPPQLGIDFPRIAFGLSSKLHVALTVNSAIERLGLRADLQEAYPEAEFHDLPGPDGVQGWWESPDAYARLIRSTLPQFSAP